LDDFEDGALNTPGVTAVGGSVLAPGSLTDSVDADDGLLNGLGTAGRSWFNSAGSTGVRFNFNASVLGALPTHAGLVWTDGQVSSDVTFTVFDSAGSVLDTIVANVGDGGFGGTTAEDRFFGYRSAAGIGGIAIRTSSGGGGLEVDHLQYGIEAIPEPGTLAVLAGLGLLVRRKKSS
jgi:hypothetical protein